MPVAVVTDSTAYLPAELGGTYDLTVVPLTVVVNGIEGLEGIEITPAEVGDRVRVVDSGTTGMGLGFVALGATTVARHGADLEAVRQSAVDHAARVSTLFYVDTLEFLRRGGRINAASALVGTALSVKPILHVVDGSIVLRDKVRTAGRALARLVDVAVEAAGPGAADVAVHHLGTPDRAAALADAVTMRLGDRLRDCYITEIGAVVAAHVGPNVAGVVGHRR